MRRIWIATLICGFLGSSTSATWSQAIPSQGTPATASHSTVLQSNGYVAMPMSATSRPMPSAPLYGRYPIQAYGGPTQQVAYQSNGYNQFVGEPQLNPPQFNSPQTSAPTQQFPQQFHPAGAIQNQVSGQAPSQQYIAPQYVPSQTPTLSPQPIPPGTPPGTTNGGPQSVYVPQPGNGQYYANPVYGSVTGYGTSGCNPVGQNYFTSPSVQNCQPCGTAEFACEQSAQSSISKILRGNGSNLVVGVNALAFSRDYEDDYGLGRNSLSQYLFSTDASNDYFGGFETVLSRRNCGGSGFEIRYWGLYPNSTTANFGYMPDSSLTGLQQVYFVPDGFDVLQIFNSADWHRVYRQNNFQNVEANLLRNGGCFTGWGCRKSYYEILGGFRWFEFDENFTYSAFNSNGNYPAEFNYDITTRNTLLGLQLGGRVERCLTNRLRLFSSLKGGVYNNHIYHNSCMCDNTGALATIWAGPYNGTDFDFTSRKNDLAFLSEIDLGLLCQVSCKARLNFGYRIFGVNGVALAPDQIPYNFTDAADIRRVNSNGSLLLHGAYGGFQYCY